MATNWTVLVGNDLSRVLSRKIIQDADESTADGVLPDETLDPSSTNNRSQVLVTQAVTELRAMVRLGGKSALAVTASSVPPESENHVLSYAAWRLVNSTPNLNAALFNEGMRAGLKELYEQALRHYEAVLGGRPVTPPSDPTGQDYETAVDEDTESDTYNPAIPGAVRWGDMNGTDDDYATGETSDGATDLPIDMKTW